MQYAVCRHAKTAELAPPSIYKAILFDSVLKNKIIIKGSEMMRGLILLCAHHVSLSSCRYLAKVAAAYQGSGRGFDSGGRRRVEDSQEQ